MILPRPSNTGILIGAVLVGLLGLGANYFMRLDPSMVASYMPKPPIRSSDTSTVEANSHGPPSAAGDSQAPSDAAIPEYVVKTELKELARLEGDLKRLFQQWERYGRIPEKRRKSLPDIVRRSQTICKRATEHSRIPDEQKRNARMSLLAIAFYAASMDAAQSKPLFDEVYSTIEESLGRDDQIHAAILKFLVHHDLKHPQEDALLTDLKRFSDQFDSPDREAFLYRQVATEIYKRGFETTSHRILRAGILEYRPHPAANRLVAALIAQGGQVPK